MCTAAGRNVKIFYAKKFMTDNEITSGNLDPYQGLFYKLAKI